MKYFLALLAVAFVANCSPEKLLSGSYSVSGLDYDGIEGTFSGIPMTMASQMPASGSATFNGEYRAYRPGNRNIFNLWDKGSAAMAVNFGTRIVSLDISGDLTGSASGAIVGTTVVGGTGFNFNGDFYGSNATVAAGYLDGNFATSGGGTSDATGTFIVGQ